MKTAKSFVVPALAGFKPQFPPQGGTTNDFAVLLSRGKNPCILIQLNLFVRIADFFHTSGAIAFSLPIIQKLFGELFVISSFA